jgi:hypothetical protein
MPYLFSKKVEKMTLSRDYFFIGCGLRQNCLLQYITQPMYSTAGAWVHYYIKVDGNEK